MANETQAEVMNGRLGWMTYERVYRCFSMDYTSEIHYAMARDNVLWTRLRGRGRGGRYQNGAWRIAPVQELPANAHETTSKCRLPWNKEASAAA